MRKFLVIAAIFFAGYYFGDTALRVLRVAWSEISAQVKPEIRDLQIQLENIEMPEVN